MPDTAWFRSLAVVLDELHLVARGLTADASLAAGASQGESGRVRASRGEGVRRSR
ncbi:hypothetical protein G6O69_35830 [Pseudenhygromyxa sp. WMMC2535]|uniref:hypothetical protein n=1 Tax=Pseudenhygromyxa sp. WMMC2535 TaxID=2712867 RepID=UPI001595A192|nr:hypothetical protein [Pseudenhygromyxa sp. WMMC2535]NVB43250.1 hypothetical protein [Pseudenhygromyxa sp. WMMC2535]